MAAVFEPLIPALHPPAVEGKLRLHAAAMDAPPSPPAAASDFNCADIDSASNSSSASSSPSTPTSNTSAVPHTPSPEQPSEPPPSARPTLLSPAAKKFSALLTPPSPAARRLVDAPSSEEQLVTRIDGESLHGDISLQSVPAVDSSSLLHSIVASSPSPEPIPLPDELMADTLTAASPFPSPDPSSSSDRSLAAFRSAYPEDDAASRSLKLIYKVFHLVCDLFFAVDKDLHNLTDKRQRASTKQLETGVESLHSQTANHRKSIPATVSPGYGELARRGFDKVLHYLCEEAPDVLRMGADCSFLDIGSGFGKCVLHAKVRGNVRESVGIEYIPVRHEKAAETLHLLRARFVPGITDQYQQGGEEERRVQELLESVDLSGVQLVQGDITDAKHHALLYRASHIYMFDVVFSDHTMAQILPAIEQANFALFACYHRPAYLERLGCTQFVCIHKMAMKTTGKQSFTCYFYVKAAAGAKVTRHTQQRWVEAAVKEGRAAQQDGQEGEEGAEGAAAHKRKRKSKAAMFSNKKRKAHSTKASRRRRAAGEGADEEEAVEDEEEAQESEAEEEEAKEEVDERQEKERARKHRSSKKRSHRVEMFDVPVVPVVEKKKREMTPGTAEVLARDAFNAAVIKAVAARLVIEAEREARLQRRYALGVMQALLRKHRDDEPAAEGQPTSGAEHPTPLPAAASDDAPDHPPPFQRSSTLITDVHDMNGAKDYVDAPALLFERPALTVSMPSAVYPLSSLALLPMSPSKAQMRSPAKASTTPIGHPSPARVSLVSVPSSSLAALSTPPTITPTSGSGSLTLSWPANSVSSTSSPAAAPSTATTVASSPQAPVTSSSAGSPPLPASSPTSSAHSDEYVCPYCSNCVECASEYYQLPRHQLSRKQILAHGTQHALPLLLRALPFAVQACVEAWDEAQPTEPRQLLPRMEYSLSRHIAHVQEDATKDESSTPFIYSTYAPPPVKPAPVTQPAVPRCVAPATPSSAQQDGDVAAAKKEMGAWRKPTGKTKNTKYVYARDRVKNKAQPSPAPEQQQQQQQQQRVAMDIAQQNEQPQAEQQPQRMQDGPQPAEAAEAPMSVSEVKAEVVTEVLIAPADDASATKGMEVETVAEQSAVQ